jgi:hypothetical protein
MNFEILIPIAMYVLPTILILFAYSRRRRRKDEPPDRGVIHPAEDLSYRSGIGRELENGA